MRITTMPIRLLLLSLATFLALGLAACGQNEAPKQDSTETAKDAYVDKMAELHADDTTAPSGETQLGEIPDMPVLTENVVYAQVNGHDVTGFLAYPESAHGGLPGIMVFHEWWGLNDNIREMTKKLAAQGYVVLALDLYDGQAATTPDEAHKLMQAAMDHPDTVNDNIRQAYKFMTEQVGALSVASVGWCLGGTMAFNSALMFPDKLAGVVVYYGFVTGTSRDQMASLKMPILAFFGDQDQGNPVDSVKAWRDSLKNLGKDSQVFIYEGAGHAFANPTGQNFRAEPAKDAWEKTLKFLDRTLNAEVNQNVIDPDAPANADKK